MRAILAALLLLILLPAPARTETIEVEPGISLYAERIGDGPHVVIIPGGFLYNDSVRRIARPDRTLILYDMRNRGRSARVTRDDAITLQADVADLEAVRRHYRIERTSLIGYSYLGLMVMLYAVEHPGIVERVIQIGPAPPRFGTTYPDALVWRDPAPVMPPDEVAAVERAGEAGLIRTDPREYCRRSERLTRLRLVVDPRVAETIDVERRCAMENEWPVNLDRHFTIHFAGSIQNFEPPRDALRALDLPVLTVHGTMDRNAPFAAGVEWASLLRDGRLIIARRAAHPVWLEYPPFWEEVGQFLDGEWPDSAIRIGGYDDAIARLSSGLDAR